MKILLCGIPLGRNNVGDEAIVAGVVKIFREVFPGVELTVSTDDPKTATRLGVNVCPLFGFDVVPYDPGEMKRVIEAHDATVWCGATGLSDYPELPCAMLQIAQAAGKKTAVWNVGMNSELNPAKYTVRGKRRTVLELSGKLSLGLLNPLESAEEALRNRARETIRKTLDRCDLVVNRDPQSREEVLRCGVKRGVIAGADSALVLEPADLSKSAIAPEFLAALERPGKKAGVCISAQRNITDTRALRDWIDGIAASGVGVYFIPMNPVTDAALMEELRKKMKNPDTAFLAPGFLEPEEVLAIAGKMDVIVASRLHLLILASILHVPVLGISRGSKVDNFLEPFGIKAAGSVEQCDFDSLRRNVDYWIGHRGEFTRRSEEVRAHLMERLAKAKTALGNALG